MAGEKDAPSREASQEEFDAEFGLEGNAPHEQAYVSEEEAPEEPPTPNLSESGTDMSDVESEIQSRQMFEGMDDNVAILEKRQEEEQKAAEAEEAEEEEEAPAEEEEIEAEEEEEVEAEAEEEAEEEEEVEEPEEGEATPWSSWLDENVEDTDERQALFEELLEDENLTIPYRADGEVHRATPSELVQRAAGYSGESEVTKKAQKVQAQAEQLAQREQELQTTQEQLEAFQENLTATIDDPDNFSSWLAQRANLDYMEALAENLADTVRTARENPELFTMRRELGGIKGMLEQVVNGGSGRGAAPGGPGRADAGAEDAGGETIPEDLNFQPGVGYPAPYHHIAHREVNSILRGAGADEVSFQDVAAQWQEEGKKRPITEVALDLLEAGRDDSRKREIALDPPNKGRKARSKAGGGGKKKKTPSGGGGDGGGSSQPETWDGIQDKVEKEVRQLQSGGGI